MKNNLEYNKSLKILLIAVFTFFGMILSNIYTPTFANTLFEKSFKANSGDNLTVSIISGDIIVKSWDKEEVGIVVTGKESVKEYLDFFFEETSGGIKVWTEKKSDWNSWLSSPNFKFEVMVPAEYGADLKTSGGDVSVKSLNGKLKISTSGGDILISSSVGALVAKTSGGDIKSKNFTGDSELKTSGGDIEVLSNNGNTKAKTSGGDIMMIVSNGEVIGATSGGDIQVEYSGNNVGIELTTSGGDIGLKLPEDISANLTLITTGGDIENSLTNVKVKEVSRSKFIGKINSGGIDVICKTTGGDIVLKKK